MLITVVRHLRFGRKRLTMPGAGPQFVDAARHLPRPMDTSTEVPIDRILLVAGRPIVELPATVVRRPLRWMEASRDETVRRHGSVLPRTRSHGGLASAAAHPRRRRQPPCRWSRRVSDRKTRISGRLSSNRSDTCRLRTTWKAGSRLAPVPSRQASTA